MSVESVPKCKMWVWRAYLSHLEHLPAALQENPWSAGYLHFGRQWCVPWACLAVLWAPAVAWAVLWRQKAVGHLFFPPTLFSVVNYQWSV